MPDALLGPVPKEHKNVPFVEAAPADTSSKPELLNVTNADLNPIILSQVELMASTNVAIGHKLILNKLVLAVLKMAK